MKSMVIALEILRKSWGKVTATQSRQDFSEMNERWNLNRREERMGSSVFKVKDKKLISLTWNKKALWFGAQASKLNVPEFKTWPHHWLAMPP